MADVQFANARDRRHAGGVAVGETVAQVDGQSLLSGKLTAAEIASFGVAVLRRGRIGVAPGVEFDRLGPQRAGGFDLPRIRKPMG